MKSVNTVNLDTALGAVYDWLGKCHQLKNFTEKYICLPKRLFRYVTEQLN